MQSRSEPPERAAGTGTSGSREAVQRWRLVIARSALPAELAQRDLHAAWDAALTATGLPLAGMDEERPKPRFAIAAPLVASLTGEAELADLWLVARLPRWFVREALAERLPPGHALVDLYDVWLGEPALPGRVAASRYRATIEPAIDAAALRGAADALLAAETLPRERRRGETVVAYDLRPFLDGIDIEPHPGGAIVRLTLRHDPAKGVGRPEEAIAALEASLGRPIGVLSLVREALVLTEPAPPVAAQRKEGRTAQRVPATAGRMPPLPRP